MPYRILTTIALLALTACNTKPETPAGEAVTTNREADSTAVTQPADGTSTANPADTTLGAVGRQPRVD